MSHTKHAAKAPHKQAAIDNKAARHHEQIAEAAYFHAEHRGFKGGDPVVDWLAGEVEIDSTFKKGEVVSAH